jgi:hypothetical protein
MDVRVNLSPASAWHQGTIQYSQRHKMAEEGYIRYRTSARPLVPVPVTFDTPILLPDTIPE